MLGRKKPRIRKQAGTHGKRLRFELLEHRLLLAASSVIQQQFRADDFSVSGVFGYDMQIPASNNYHDVVPSGSFSSTTGHIAWTSQKDATGFIEGQATSPGSSTFEWSGSTWLATRYTLEETGRFDFSIDATAAPSQLHMITAKANTTYYTSYENPRVLGPSGPDFPQPNPAPSHFFGGDVALYTGTFSPSTQQVGINYEQASPRTSAGSPPAALQWADQTATDMVLAVNTSTPISVPNGWATVPPVSQLVAPAVDLSQGLDLTVDVHGKPVATANVQTPVATVRLYWATSATDMSTAQEIPVTAGAGALGVYWNSSRLQAVVTQFPTRPANAAFLRVSIDAASGADATASNNTQFVAIFQARSATSGPVSADSVFDGRTTSSLLAAADVAESNIQVQAYAPTSSLGAVVQVANQQGGYRYDPTAVPQFRALAQGETANDVIQFLAVKGAVAGSLASHTITVTGVNDSPIAGADSSATTSYRKLLLAANTLLSNDTDVDHNDVVTVSSVASASQRGATVQAIYANSTIVQIEYNPLTSDELKGLAPGQQRSDEFTYQIVDQQGVAATGHVSITVTGSPLLTINSVPPQSTRSDQLTTPIPITVIDPDGAVANLQLSGQAANVSLIPNANLQFSGTGQQRQLVITPVSGNLGRTQIQLTVSDGLGRFTSLSFLMVVGSPNDRDLDGVLNTVEDVGPNSGDMNRDGIQDSAQPNVASLPGQGSGAYLCLTVPGLQALGNIATLATPDPSGPAVIGLFPLGLVHYEVLVDGPGAASTVTLQTNLATPTLNRYYQYDASAGDGVGWLNFMENGDEGARVFHDRIEVKLRDGGRGDQIKVSDGRIIAEGAPAHVARPWQNDQPLDANNDGSVTPLDVLTLITQFNLERGGDLLELPAGTNSLPAFLDTSGDGTFSPLDVLTVINYLNNPPSGTGEAADPAAAPVPGGSLSAIVATPTLDTAVSPDATGLTRPPELLAGPAVVPPSVGGASIAKRKADFTADVDALLAEVGRLEQL